ncbi:hypothetical protein [Microbacterium forte]|uniref:hypothetical protein n=1 Tax=Microbacterium forte TaxID=2982533 RepID=UPI0028931693|nr:hypothetical protein [Microbacterium sp. A(2022)]
MTTQVDLGHGRGWASPAAAASILRIDRQLGRLADINEAGRSPEKANENRRKWLAYERYLNGGPWAPKAPFALGAEDSVHCSGDAADSDDWYDPAAAAVWRANGWRQTALYPHNLAKHEPWHGEYFPHLDTRRFDPAPAGGALTTEQDELTMTSPIWNVVAKIGDAPESGTLYYGTESGKIEKLTGYSRALVSVAFFGAQPAANGTIPDLIPTIADRGGDWTRVQALHKAIKGRPRE